MSSFWGLGGENEKAFLDLLLPPSPPTYSMFCTDIVVPKFLESSKEKSL